VAKLTFKELIRERFFIGLVIVDLIFCFLSYFLSEISAGDNVKIAMDLILSFQFSSLSIYIVMATTNSFQKDLYQKVIYQICSKPITRKEYIVGKFLGFASVSFLISFFLSIINTIAIFLINKISRLVTPHVVLTERLLLFGFMCFLMLMMLIGVATVFSMFFSNPALASFSTLLIFLSGLEISAVKEITLSATFVSDFNKLLVKIAYYILPNFSLFNIKDFVVHALYQAISVSFVLLTCLYTILYTMSLSIIAIILFERKEL